MTDRDQMLSLQGGRIYYLIRTSNQYTTRIYSFGVSPTGHIVALNSLLNRLVKIREENNGTIVLEAPQGLAASQWLQDAIYRAIKIKFTIMQL